MQKIINKDNTEKKQRRNKIILSIILVVLMIFSTAGYAIYQSTGSGNKKVTYNGIKFTLGNDGYWHFSFLNQDFLTRYNPYEVSNISASISLKIDNYNNKILYFSYDSDRDGINEILQNLKVENRVQYVCIDDCNEDLPVKTCSDNIIIIQEFNSTSLIKQEQNCIYILAEPADIIKASDKFIFKILGI